MCAAAAWAYSITGTIADETGDPLPDATVRLLAARDSSFVKGTIAASDGRFRLTDVANGKYILETNYIGYNKNYRDLKIEGRNLKTDTIKMGESSVMLAEATVIGVKTPIKVMEDTIEFNADTYKTQPNAVVEDLLKRLPGVEVDSDGKITANGKEVTKILVDGKEFFADDPKVASKNLPVNIVDKLQVVDRKSDLARLTGVDDGEDETVINLTVKKGMQNGWFGTVEGGYGTDDRYQASFNVNRFWNGNQITFLGSANNTNQLGFTDGNGARFRRFGGDQGINNSQNFGVNFNVGNGEKLRVGGDVMYSHTDRNTLKRQERQYLFPDSTSYERGNSDARDQGHNLRADFRVEWKPDSFNTIDFRPSFSFNRNISNSLETDTLLAGERGLPQVNRTFNTSASKGNSYEASGRLIYNHNFKQRRGRSFSVMANYRFSDVREDDNAFTYNRFYRLMNKLGTDSIESYDQWTESHTWSNTVTARASWTEPLGDASKGRFLTFSYRLQYRWNNSDKFVDRRYPDLMGDTENLDNLIFTPWERLDTLSKSFRNNFFTQDFRIGFKLVKKMYNLDAGLSLTPSMSRSENPLDSRYNISERWVWNFAPFLRFRYKMDKQSSLNIFYHGRSSQPSMTQLQPVPDYSNALNVIIGNPGLAPTFSHNIRLRLNKFSAESQRSIMSMMDASIEQNSIISHTTYDRTTGGRVTRYENVNGVWNIRAMNMFSQPFGKNKSWSFNNNAFVNYRQNVGYNNDDLNRSGSLMFAISPSIAFRPENLELELRPRYRVQATFNSLPNINTSTIHNYGGEFNGTYTAPFGLVLSTDLTFTASKGYAEGFNTNTWMWNATISYQFLRDRSATFSLRAYDLLQQKSNISRSVTANYIDDIEYNSLTRYFMATLTYTFNTFGKGNQPESNNMMHHGPGGPGGRGPMGPPPGMRH